MREYAKSEVEKHNVEILGFNWSELIKLQLRGINLHKSAQKYKTKIFYKVSSVWNNAKELEGKNQILDLTRQEHLNATADLIASKMTPKEFQQQTDNVLDGLIDDSDELFGERGSDEGSQTR